METKIWSRAEHWENIYRSKKIDEVSWYQEVPEISLEFIKELNVENSAAIIDIGGGDSFLVDNLLDLGYENITVLDISMAALERAKQRLGDKAERVKWINADAATFNPSEKYDVWHDRAAFHFLTDEKEIAGYIQTLESVINPGGKVIIGTFSEDGPTKCSGIEIKQYSKSTLANKLTGKFNMIKCIKTDHKTPFNTVQNFTFCSFEKR